MRSREVKRVVCLFPPESSPVGSSGWPDHRRRHGRSRGREGDGRAAFGFGLRSRWADSDQQKGGGRETAGWTDPIWAEAMRMGHLESA
jgi:hypothetical protein